jgi:hypothetical protein
MLEIDARGFGLARVSDLNNVAAANCPSGPIGVWNSPTMFLPLGISKEGGGT